MVKVYAISLAVGVVGLIVLVLGGALAENVGRPARDPGALLGVRGKSAVGVLLGFGMGGMAAEFAPLDFSWQISLVIAVLAAAISYAWVRYAVVLAER